MSPEERRERQRIAAALRRQEPGYAERNKEYQRRYRVERRETYIDSDLRARYGITLKEYEDLLKAQDSLCPICTDVLTSRADRPAGANGGHTGVACVDHDHETGTVRALLCSRCNIAVGMIRECPKIAEGLRRYTECL